MFLRFVYWIIHSSNTRSTVNATARDYHGFTAYMSYARLVLSACTKKQLAQATDKPLPPRHLATSLIQHYLDNFFTQYPFFDQTSLFHSVDSVYKASTDVHATATAFDHWSVRLVLAIANASMSDRQGDQYQLEALEHVSAALVYADQVLRPGVISSVQALLFLAQYARLDPHHFDSWSLIGAASRAMVDLGLHQDPAKGTVPKAKLDLRRRLFYCVYVMDRTTSIVQNRAFSFSENSSHVTTPYASLQAPQAASNGSQWLKCFDNARDLVKLTKLQSQWYQDLFQSGREPWVHPYRYIWQTCHNLAAWFDDISSSCTKTQRAMFELELLYAHIYLLSPSPRIPITHPYAQNLVFENCISYAALLTRVLHDPNHPSTFTFYDAKRAYTTAQKLAELLAHDKDRLLSGIIPEPPPLPANSPTPPPILTPPMDRYSNVVRSITCMDQLIQALRYFGVRWGYMSWSQNVERASKSTMLALHQDIWDLQAMGLSSHLNYDPSIGQAVQTSSSNPVPTLAHQHPSPVHTHTRKGDYMPTLETAGQLLTYAQQPNHHLAIDTAQSKAAKPHSFIVSPAQPSPDTVTYTPTQAVGFNPAQMPPPPPLEYQPTTEGPHQQFAAWHGLG